MSSSSVCNHTRDQTNRTPATRSQTFARSHARTQEESGVKYSPTNQFIEGSTSGLVINSYLNDNLEDKQCYFSLDSFSTKRVSKVAFYILGMCYTLVLPKTQKS